jgi:hypothetical protein
MKATCTEVARLIVFQILKRNLLAVEYVVDGTVEGTRLSCLQLLIINLNASRDLLVRHERTLHTPEQLASAIEEEGEQPSKKRKSQALPSRKFF